MDVACIANYRIPSDITPVIQTIRLCEGFAQAGHDVTLYYPDRTQGDEALRSTTIKDYYDIEHEFETKSYPCMELNVSDVARGDYSLLSLITVSRATFTVPTAFRMRLKDADLHITRGVPMAALLVGLGLPTVVESYSGTFHRTSPDRVLLPIMDRFQSFRNVVVPTQAIAQAWQAQGVSAERTTVLPTAVDLSNYRDPKSKGEAKRALGLPTDRRLVVYTGKLIPARGSRIIAEACRNLDDVQVVLVGGNDEQIAAMERYLDERGINNVQLVGWVRPARVPDYQWAADVLVSATKPGDFNPMEAVPLKIVEYMAAGRPIVATNIQGVTEVLEDGRNAVLVPPDDVDAMAEGIRWVFEHPGQSQELATRAAEDVSEWSWKDRAEDIVESST